MQVAAYGGKLRYTLSYTAGAQGSPLSDPDVQITVSMGLQRQAGRRGACLMFLPFQSALSWPGTHPLLRAPTTPHVWNYRGRARLQGLYLTP